MEEDNKSSTSKTSLTSRSGKALDKHCFAINILTGIRCSNKKQSGKNYAEHRKTSNHDKDTKDFTTCGENCQTCLNFKGKYLLRTALLIWAPRS
jgi:hypothetical protein